MASSRGLRRLAYFSVAAGGLYGVDHFYQADALQRNLRTFWAGALITADYKINFRADAAFGELEKIHSRVAQRILDTCKKNGGLYIKFGQAISSQNHILPPQYVDAFKVLYDAAPVVPRGDVEKLFVEEFGKTPEAIFDDFEWEPVGSASIAQVHRAKLKDGTRVAVKVQKPYIRKQMEWDLWGQSIITHALEFFFDIPMTWSLDYAHSHVRKEVDFVNEARNAERAKRDFAAEPTFAKDVYVPTVYWDFTSPRVMTAEWIDGTALSNSEEIKKKYDVNFVVGSIIDMFGFQIFKSGFLHSDPHPGNFLIRPNPTNPKRPQLVLLDHGLYIDESPSFRVDYCQFWKALMLVDLDRLKEINTRWGLGDIQMSAMAALQRPFDPEKAKREGLSALAKPTTKDIYEAQMRMKAKAKEMLLDEHKFPKELIFVGRNMTIVRGINKAFGSPIDRISVTARWAVRGAATSEAIALSKVREPPSTSLGYVSRYVSENLTSFQFEAHLWTLALGFYASKVYEWVARDLLGYSGVKNYEEVLEEGAKQAMKGHFGIAIDERTFDA